MSIETEGNETADIPVQKSSLIEGNRQPESNEDRFLQPLPTPTPLTSEQESPDIEPTPIPRPQHSPTGEKIRVEKITITDSSIFSEEDFRSLIDSLEGDAVTIEELQSLTDAINQAYLEKGYITSRVVLVEESLLTGEVEIRAIEGSIEEIKIEGTERINPDYIRSRVRLGVGKPFNPTKLEDQLRLLQANPLFETVEASLRSGTGVGQSLLIVRVTEADPFVGNISIDNYSPPSVGSERAKLDLLYRNLFGLGDTIAGSYTRTLQGGSQTYELNYLVPVNAMDGTVQLRASYNSNEVIQDPFDELDIEGNSELYEISYRQPFIRTPQQEFALSFGFTFQDGQTFTFAGPTPFGLGPDEEGRSRTSVFKFGQDYVTRDVSGAWALRSLFSVGTGLFDATINEDPIPDSRFFSWLGQIQRVQILNPNHFLVIQADLQLTPDGLLPSQQFIIGGGQSVRGYRQNVRAADNGFRFSVEDRITLERNEGGDAIFQLAPFFDAGYVWNVSDNPNLLQDQTFIAGIGVGVLWELLPDLNLRLDYGYPLIDLDDRGENIQEEGFYFSVDYLF